MEEFGAKATLRLSSLQSHRIILPLGGGVVNDDDTAVLSNSVVAENTTTNGVPSDVLGNFLSASHHNFIGAIDGIATDFDRSDTLHPIRHGRRSARSNARSVSTTTAAPRWAIFRCPAVL